MFCPKLENLGQFESPESSIANGCSVTKRSRKNRCRTRHHTASYTKDHQQGELEQFETWIPENNLEKDAVMD